MGKEAVQRGGDGGGRGDRAEEEPGADSPAAIFRRPGPPRPHRRCEPSGAKVAAATAPARLRVGAAAGPRPPSRSRVAPGPLFPLGHPLWVSLMAQG